MARPRAGGPVEDSGVLGERVLALVLARAAGGATARRAAERWGADHYVVWSDGDHTCIRWHLVMDTPTDTAELVSACAGSRPPSGRPGCSPPTASSS